MSTDTNNQDEQPYEFFIPDNHTESGKVLDGMIDLRNAGEAVVLTGILFYIEKGILFGLIDSFNTVLFIMAITLIPIFVLSLIGINGDCFSIFCRTFFVFLKDKRKLRLRRIYKNGQEEKSKHARGATSSKKKKTTKTEGRKQKEKDPKGRKRNN